MAFEVATTAGETPAPAPVSAEPVASAPSLSAVPGGNAEAPAAEVSHFPDGDNEPPKKGGRPTLTRIK
jgi:stringent starvation protein B